MNLVVQRMFLIGVKMIYSNENFKLIQFDNDDLCYEISSSSFWRTSIYLFTLLEVNGTLPLAPPHHTTVFRYVNQFSSPPSIAHRFFTVL